MEDSEKLEYLGENKSFQLFLHEKNWHSWEKQTFSMIVHEQILETVGKQVALKHKRANMTARIPKQAR